jgi:hypothetical protein
VLPTKTAKEALEYQRFVACLLCLIRTTKGPSLSPAYSLTTLLEPQSIQTQASSPLAFSLRAPQMKQYVEIAGFVWTSGELETAEEACKNYQLVDCILRSMGTTKNPLNLQNFSPKPPLGSQSIPKTTPIFASSACSHAANRPTTGSKSRTPHNHGQLLNNS